MLLSHVEYPQTSTPLLSQPHWEPLLEWLKTESQTAPDGEHEISGRDIFAIIQSLTTITRSEGVFEAHREYIDLHYCLEGEEIIEWAPVNALEPKGEFNTEKDYGHYSVPKKTIAIHFTPGVFGIYLPADAHMPKIAPGNPGPLRKVVVKIRATLLS